MRQLIQWFKDPNFLAFLELKMQGVNFSHKQTKGLLTFSVPLDKMHCV